MAEPSKLPSRWESKKTRTTRLSRYQLDQKLNISAKNDTDDEDCIAEDPVDAKLKPPTSRSSGKKIAAVVSKFCMIKTRLVTEMGFQGILQMSQINKLDRSFTERLLTHINCKTHRLEWGKQCEIHICDTNLQPVLGIPCGPNTVCGLEDDSAPEKVDFIRICIGTGKDEDDDDEDEKIYDSLEAAENNVTREYPNGMTRTEEEQFKVSFCVFLVCRFLCPMHQPNSGSKIFWGALLDPSKIHTYNWSKLVADNIIDSARKVQYTLDCKGVVSYVGGCSLALQVLFLDYLRFGCSNRPGVLIPRIADYTCSSMAKLILQHKNALAQEGNVTTLVPQPQDLSAGTSNSESQGKENLITPIKINTESGQQTFTASGLPSICGDKRFEAMEHTVSSFNQAVSATKLPMRQKLALRYYMARMVRHQNTFKNEMIKEAIELTKKLGEAMDNEIVEPEVRASLVPDRVDTSADHNLTSSKASAQDTNCKIAAKPKTDITTKGEAPLPDPGLINPDDPFCLGIEWEQYEKHKEQSTCATAYPTTSKRPLIPISTDLSKRNKSNSTLAPYTKGYNSDPETSRAQSVITTSNSQRRPSFLYNTPSKPSTFDCRTHGYHSDPETPLAKAPQNVSFIYTTPAKVYVGGQNNSPSTLNRNYSETALLLRLYDDDENRKIAGKRLSFEVTESPVKKIRCSSGRIAKSPWGQGLAHPVRNIIIISSFYEWLNATSSTELSRVWIAHGTPRYIEITGCELKNWLCGEGQTSYNLFDLGARRMVQLDSNMFKKANAQVWRTILESDFAMMVLAEYNYTNNISIRAQFIGSLVKHQIKNSRMIAVPACVRDNWCSYFLDMKLKLVHVIDPMFNPNNAAATVEDTNVEINTCPGLPVFSICVVNLVGIFFLTLENNILRSSVEFLYEQFV